MPYDEDPKQKPEHGLEEQKEEQFSFLQETIKPKPVTRRKILTQLARVGIYGLIFGAFACLGFFALKPWAQTKLQGDGTRAGSTGRSGSDPCIRCGKL